MITITEDRTEALKAGWEALSERMPTIEGNNFDGFHIQAFKKDDITIGMLMSRGPEVHVAILPQYRRRWLSARLIKAVFEERLEKYGYIVTSVMKNNINGQNFVERLGFEPEYNDNEVIHYRMIP